MDRIQMERYLEQMGPGACVYMLEYDHAPRSVTKAHGRLLELLTGLRCRRDGVKYVAVTEQVPHLHHHLVLDGLGKGAVTAYWGEEGCYKLLELGGAKDDRLEAVAWILTRYSDSIYAVSGVV